MCQMQWGMYTKSDKDDMKLFFLLCYEKYFNEQSTHFCIIDRD